MMKKPVGISFNLGAAPGCFPVNICKLPLRTIRPKLKKDGVLIEPKYFGFRLDLMFGTLRRPVPKIYKREFWLRNASRFGDPNYIQKETAINPWNSGNHWFVLTIPWCLGLFLSAFIRVKDRVEPGFYLGTKTYEVNRISSQLMDYAKQKYLVDEEGRPIYTWATEKEQGNLYLCISASLRSDLLEYN